MPLLILKIDRYFEELKIPDIQYYVLHPMNKESLDLSLCKDTKIEIKIPVSIDEENLIKYNISSDYYNNKCFIYTSDDDTDVSLEYRRKEFIHNNMALCESIVNI